MKIIKLKKFKILIPIILILFFVISITGCITKRGIESDEPLKYSNTASRYIGEYGNDYTTKQIIKSNTIYEIITWPSKGVSITTVMETGIVTSVENFDPNSGYIYMK